MLHRQGALGEAASRYADVLRSDPLNTDALYYLAMIACQQGRFELGVDLARKALAIDPSQSRIHNVLGLALGRLGQDTAALRSFDSAVVCQPDFAEAHGNRANTLASLGRLSEALTSYDRTVELYPDSFEDWCNRGSVLFQLGRHAEAIESYDRALVLRRDFVEAHLQRGIVLSDIGRHQEALQSYENALKFAPGHAAALNNRGNTLRHLGRKDEALRSFDRAIQIAPDHVAALSSRAALLNELGQRESALESCDMALSVDPRNLGALSIRGGVLSGLGRHDEALTSLDAALAIEPDHVGALNNRGIALDRLGRHDQALASLERALEAERDNTDVLNNRGNALFALLRAEEALACYDRVLALAPEHAAALGNRGNALFELGQYEEALASYDRALSLRPGEVETVYRRGVVLRHLQRFEEAISSYRAALALNPNHADAFSGLASCCLLVCDWRELSRLHQEILTRVSAGTSAVEPFLSLAIGCTAAEQVECARNYVRLKQWAGAAAVRGTKHAGKLRIAYVSADFRRHPVAHLIAHLFALHDRTRFEVVGIALGNDDRSELRARIARSFDRFYDVGKRTDRQIAEFLRELEIDIAIDLMGHTEHSRLGIFALRPAPIQATYLGYPGTTGAEFIDYVIADPIVLPLEQQTFYSEHIIHLPESFQINDCTKAVAPRTPTRREAGLPETGVVFCCFNQSYKITPSVFDVWMRLLGRVEGSVLWLSHTNYTARTNLHREALARGICAERVIFARREERMEDHLARIRLADLFLDTLPYNAHTTASDALWVGVPVLTCRGATFAGRVAASLLNAIGAPELVTDSHAEYEALALTLARDPSRRAEIRRKIEKHRATYALFDTDRTRRHLEAAYTTMWSIYQAAEGPRGFRVDLSEKTETDD